MDESGPVEIKLTNKEAVLVYSNGIPVNSIKGVVLYSFFGSDGEVMVNRGRFKVIVKVRHCLLYSSENKIPPAWPKLKKLKKLLLKNATIKLYEAFTL